MLIDWFTVGAQLLNFIILVWLLQRFLYKPILRAIDAREARVAQALAEADAKKAEALRERDEFQSKNEALEQQRSALLLKMNGEVEAERARLLGEAHQAADNLSAQRMERLQSDARMQSQAIRCRAQQEVFALARKVLAELAGASLEERMVEMFIRQLRALGDAEKKALKASFREASGAVTVRSAFGLHADHRAALEAAVRELVSAQLSVEYEVAEDLVSGIELIANGQKMAWNIEAYLAEMERGLGEALDLKGGSLPSE